ncbi:MAG: hypothetical protein RMK91_02750 [Pseudanabaenaceae cyanobacterium SKYGB_i_bin29]|nr:hypothetical protein [Pseudanabaenaceae cyanobacterium SKYG29]MDW8420763.1 hypothetical protein [Pseudanabaenaceae cyanobacterium SKYGB_i_bin29]
MVSWEFLLQKKGDRSWLPLESAQVEVLAGEYRLAARSGFQRQAVDITWHYTPATAEQQELSQSVQQEINEEGLLLVMPFTQLREGSWQINCRVGKDFATSLELVVLPDQAEEAAVPQFHLATTHFLLEQERIVHIRGTTSQAGELQVLVMHPQNLSPLFDRTFAVSAGEFNLPIELPDLVDFLVLLGEVRYQNHTIATLTFTFPPERLRPATPPPSAKPEVKLPPIKSSPMQPMTPPQQEVTNGKVTVVEEDTLFADLDDIFAPIAELLQEAPPPPPPKTEEFIPPPVPHVSLPPEPIEPGRPLTLRVTIPQQAGKWAVKLWLKDCQTRKLVDGPRWLLDWQTQDHLLYAESMLTFPLGYMTISLEAITVELESGAQSRKFHQDCTINLLRL